MGGSAAALGVFLAMRANQCEMPVEAWLILVENNINTESYRPDDVITSLSGDTIEVVHTDAEGRMLLADILTASSRKKATPMVEDMMITPRLLIDFATLTGTCITALSNKYIGAMTNRKEYIPNILHVSESSGERCWPFPYDEDFDEDLKSDIADVLQCRQPTEADHIYAFAFLKRFVARNVPWVHLDLGSAYKSGGLAHIGSDYTGSGVRFGFHLIQSILNK
jgi:leucyl aminopeptidase